MLKADAKLNMEMEVFTKDRSSKAFDGAKESSPLEECQPKKCIKAGSSVMKCKVKDS